MIQSLARTVETIFVRAQTLVYTLVGLMPTVYQRDSLQALLGLFLEAQGQSLPQQSQIKSPSALSRFLNQYDWSTRQMIRAVRQVKGLARLGKTEVSSAKSR